MVAPAWLSKFHRKRAEMPHVVYAHKVNRVTLSGTMFLGAEEWSTGFWLGEENADCAAPTQAAVDSILTHWTTFFTNGSHVFSNKWDTTQAKIATINTNGTTDSASVVYAYPGAAVTGVSNGAPFPPQCSLVATLLSDRPRGLASKGRMYLPGFIAGIQTNGKIEAQWRDAIALGLKTMFDSIRADADIADTPILAAKGTGAFPELTAQNDYIERVKVGDVIDTQRRRRNGLAEAYKIEILT